MGRLIAYLGAGFAALTLMYTNCGRVGEGGLVVGGTSVIMSASAKQCVLERENAYGRTFFPFLKDTCNRCHGQAQGSLDIKKSMESVLSRQSTIISQATTPHGGNNFGNTERAIIDGFLPEWNEAVMAYEACMARAGEDEIVTESKTFDIRLQSQAILEIEKTRTNRSVWAPVTFDLGDDVSGTLALEAQYWLNGYNNPIGLLVRKPRIRLAAGQAPIRIRGLSLSINDTSRPSATMYANLNLVLQPGSDVLLSNGTEAIGIDDVSASVRIGYTILQVEKNPGSSASGETEFLPLPTPTPGVPGATPTPGSSVVTYSDLMQGTPILRVFGTSCVSCHNANNKKGNLNLNDFAETSARASTILSRMNSSSSPMPPLSAGGKLPPQKIEKVQAWVDGGKQR